MLFRLYHRISRSLIRGWRAIILVVTGFLVLSLLADPTARRLSAHDLPESSPRRSLKSRNILQNEAIVQPSPKCPGCESPSRANFYQVNSEKIFLYSAFLDTRYRSNYIRIFGIQSQGVQLRPSCRISAGGNDVILADEAAFPIYPSWPSDKLDYRAYYYGCVLPTDIDTSQDMTLSVLLPGHDKGVEIPLNRNAAITKERPRDLALCVKAIWGEVDATRLVEWIEFNRLLGVEKFFFYDTTVIGKALDVLQYYESQNVAEVIPFTFALSMAVLMRKDPFRDHLASEDMLLEQVYLVSMNDCFHRNKDLYRYIMVVDIDEIIVPTEKQSILSVIQSARAEFPNASAYIFPTAWHFSQFGPIDGSTAPSYLHTQTYLKRTPVVQSQPKPVIDTKGAISINWHSVVTMPNRYGFSGNKMLPWERYGYVHHFRTTCKSDKSKCDVMLQTGETDEVLPKYLTELQPRVQKVLQILSLV